MARELSKEYHCDRMSFTECVGLVMVRCLRSYLNGMSDIVYKKCNTLVHTITFNVIVSNQQKQEKAGAA